MALLSRVADRIYWGARYTERAEDTARMIRSYGDLIVDLPRHLPLGWVPLVALTGNDPRIGGPDSEGDVLGYLIADRDNPGSIAATVTRARENLRTTREVLPREAWYALNGLHQYVDSEAERAVGRRTRDRFLARVIDDSRRLDGVLESTMTRAHSYRMWRVGRLIERADMTTRVVGLRAASILRLDALQLEDDYDEVQWMSALRSVSALQMYQRATRAPIEGAAVVRFLLYYSPFPRSVQACLDDLRIVVSQLPRPDPVLAALDRVESALASCEPSTDDGAALDAAMEIVQGAIADLGASIHEHYLAVDT